MLSPCELFEIPYGIKMLTRQLKVDHQKGLPAYLKLCCHAIHIFVIFYLYKFSFLAKLNKKYPELRKFGLRYTS